MAHEINRRQFLRSAGGTTFLALTPIARGLFTATANAAGLPLFTAVPYIQPGSRASKLVEGQESAVVAWQTEDKAADFSLAYGLSPSYGKKAATGREARLSGDKTRFNYAATLEGLPLGRKVFYKVSGNGQTVAEGYFTTRQPRGQRIRFAAIGDNACQNVGNRNIAYQAYQAHPDFLVNVGDSAYNQGLDSEYTKYLFMVFNADEAAPEVGAPIFRSMPYYAVLGNHDINFNDPARSIRAANFDDDPGALGYYTSMHLPTANSKISPYTTTTCGSPERLAAFKKAAGARFPVMANYSFDYGDVHFLCLDSNLYVDPTNAALQKWISDDLRGTDARWKFVVYHHPAFNVGDAHYTEQHMRALSPLLESCGVDFVLNGHEHIYQRCQPLRFAPSDLRKASDLHKADRLIPGKFTPDTAFDGQARTRPDGVLYITTGAGGQNLHDSKMNNIPAEWLHKRDGNQAYVAKLVSDRHSFTLFDVGEDELTMAQVDQHGVDIDRIRVTKS